MNRERELALLEEWWGRQAGTIGLVYGRRRVGKTLLVERFAADRRVVFHTAAGRPSADELAALSRVATPLFDGGLRDLHARPFADWEDAFETLAAAAVDEPLLFALDEFPELVKVTPDLENRLRAFWDRARTRTFLRIVLLGSAIRTMERIQQERSPLYGRIDLALVVHPFAPHEAAMMLPALDPAQRALVHGIVGGVPLYLEWWDESASTEENLRRLVTTPGGQLLTAGELVLASELEVTDLGRRVVYATAAGRTKFAEIKQAVGTEPTRTLERLERLGIVEKVVPVTADPRRTRASHYRIADNLLAFWLGVVDRYRGEIERGLGDSILPVLIAGLDDHLGGRYEEAFRAHLRRMAGAGGLGEEIVAVGPFWQDSPTSVEIDAVCLRGRRRAAAIIGECKWARRVDGADIVSDLERKAPALERVDANVRYAVCARERVDAAPPTTIVVTAANIYPGPRPL